MHFDAHTLKYNDDGLIPAIIQDCDTGMVLMMAYMNCEAVKRTLESGETWFWSRSRKKFWHKGETSGNTQKIKDIFYDCDRDTLLISVSQKGAACHEGYFSCFHYNIGKGGAVTVKGDKLFNPEEIYGLKELETAGQVDTAAGPQVLENLFDVILSRKKHPPEGSYTAGLFSGGIDKILKKVGEEASEVIIAGKNRNGQEIVCETADLLYHLMVLLAEEGVSIQDVFAELARRRK